MKYENFIVVNINVGVYLPNCTRDIPEDQS